MNTNNEEFPVKVDDKIYGPISMERLVSDVKSGKLTNEARFWDGEEWVPVTILLEKEDSTVWDDDEWDDNIESMPQGGPPLPTTSAWEDVNRKGRWVMIYGDHLVIEGGNMNAKDVGRIMEGEPLSGGISIQKLVNVSFKDSNMGVVIKASSFHKMYEIYSLECCLSKDDSTKFMKELEQANVRIVRK